MNRDSSISSSSRQPPIQQHSTPAHHEQQYEPLHSRQGLASGAGSSFQPHEQRHVSKQLWYHGNLPRQKAEALLLNDGDFLVRDSSSQRGDFVLTCQWRGAPLHFMINRQNVFDSRTGALKTQYQFETKLCDTVHELVYAHMHENVVISEASGARIRSPISRRMSADSFANVPSSSPYSTAGAKQSTMDGFDHSNQPLTKHKRCGSQPMLDDYTDLSTLPNASGGDFSVTKSSPQQNRRKLVCHHSRSGSEPVEHNIVASGAKLKRNHFSASHSKLSTVAKASTAAAAAGGGGADDRVGDVEATPPPKPSRIPTIKLNKNAARPRVTIRNRQLYEDDGKDYSDYDQVKAWTQDTAHNAQQQEMAHGIVGSSKHEQLLLRSSSTSTDSGFVAEQQQHHAPLYDSVADPATPKPPFMIKPDMNPASRFDLRDYNSQILTPTNKPLEGSAKSTVNMLLLESRPEVLALHLTLLDLDLFGVFAQSDRGAGVYSGLELVTLPQGAQMRQDALER